MSQNSVQQSRGKNTVCGIEEGSCNGEDAHRSSAGPSAEKALRVPREEADRTNRRQIQQASLDTPEAGFAWRRPDLPFADLYGWVRLNGLGRRHSWVIERELLQPEIITPATRNQATWPAHRPSSGVKTQGIAIFAVPNRTAFEYSGL